MALSRAACSILGESRAAGMVAYWTNAALGRRLLQETATVRLASGVVAVLPVADSGIRNVALTRDYEPELYQFAKHMIRPGDLAVDVGANLGLHALRFAQLVGEAGRVLALEPAPGPRGLLADAIRLNGFEHRIEVIAAAAGAMPADEVTLYLDDAIGLTNSMFSGWAGSSASMPVPAVTLDSVVAERGDGRPLGLVKIDAEGAETAVLSGASRLLESRRPRGIVLEITSFGDAEAVLSMVEPHGYIRVSIVRDRLSIDESCLDSAAGIRLGEDGFWYRNVYFVRDDAGHPPIPAYGGK